MTNSYRSSSTMTRTCSEVHTAVTWLRCPDSDDCRADAARRDMTLARMLGRLVFEHDIVHPLLHVITSGSSPDSLPGAGALAVLARRDARRSEYG